MDEYIIESKDLNKSPDCSQDNFNIKEDKFIYKGDFENSTRVYPKSFEETGLSEKQKNLEPLELFNQKSPVEIRCNNCSFLVQTQVYVVCPVIDVIFKVMLLIAFIALMPLIILFVTGVSLCVGASII